MHKHLKIYKITLIFLITYSVIGIIFVFEN